MEKVTKVDKKKRRPGPGRLAQLAGGILLLAAIVTAVLLLNRTPEQPETVAVTEDTGSGILCTYETEQVVSVEVTLRSGENWCLIRDEAGEITLTDDPGFRVDANTAKELLSDASVIGWTEVITADPAEYTDRLAEFGLDTPLATVCIRYSDGNHAELKIGDHSGMSDHSFYYLMIGGDDRLFALDVTTAEEFAVERALLHTVQQPVIHSARIDGIRLTDRSGMVTAWQLEGDVTAGDAEDRWLLTEPVRYPAEGEKIKSLRKNLSNLRLGAYVGEGTPDNLEKYGFVENTFTMEIHMAAAEIATTGTDGEISSVPWPEETVTFVVGGQKSDMVDYVLFQGGIYITSHYSLDVFMGKDAADTLTRYPVLTALGNLAELTVTENGRDTVYEVTRTERVAANNDLVYDDEGNLVYDHTVTMDGTELAWDRFESAYNVLLMVTVTGKLPTDWVPSGDVHTSFRFLSQTGVTHLVELMSFDAMHDAVLVDGQAVFYLVKGGMTFSLAE